MSSGMQPDSPEVVERQLMKAHLLASRHDFEGAKALLHELKENHHATLDVEEELKKIEAAIKEQTEKISVWKRLAMCLPEAHKLIWGGVVALVCGFYQLSAVWTDFARQGINGTTEVHNRGGTYIEPLKPYMHISLALIAVGAVCLLASLVADRDEVEE